MSSNEQSGENHEEGDDSPPQLSEHALAALQEFYAERLVQEQQLTAGLEGGAGSQHVEEDWVSMNIIINQPGTVPMSFVR